MATFEEAYEQSLNYFNNDELAASVFLTKYSLTSPRGNIEELTPNDMHRRLAREFARIESRYSNALTEDEIYSYLKDFKYIVPQGSPMAGVGNPYQVVSLSNCFVIESPYDSYGGILKTDQEQAQLMKRRGGVGFDISTIRPKGLLTANAANTTDGIGVFMDRFSNTCREVAQGGRRGALMLSVSVHHPEIRTFINIKRDRKRVTGANISIRLSDEFMDAVKKGQQVQLRWPVEQKVDPKVEAWVNAADLWHEIIESAHESAEPGLLFWDTIKKNSPADAYESVGFGTVSTNPSLRGDTLVLTKKGAKTIKELVEGDVFFETKNLHGNWAASHGRLSGKNVQLYKITFTNGQGVYCSKEHKWPVLTTNNKLFNHHTGQVKKKQTFDLIRQDKIPLPPTGIPFENEQCYFNQMDGFALGWLTGDGWISYHKLHEAIQYGFVFGEEDVKSGIANKVLAYTNEIATKPSSLRQDHNSKAKTYQTTDKSVRQRFAELQATEKSNGISPSIWSGNAAFVKGFVDGLFSADAYVESKSRLSKCRIVLVSAHGKLVQDVQKLLTICGIRSNIRHSISKAKTPKSTAKDFYDRFDLSISGYDAKKFATIFELTSQKKQKSLEEILQADDSMYSNERNYLVVKSVEETDLFEDVYDISVLDTTNTFITEAGITGNCGEITLSPYDSCRLLLVNAVSFVKNPFTPKAEFDWESYAKVVRIAQRLMDDIVDLELEAVDGILAKIEADPEPYEVKRIEIDLWTKIRKSAENGRRTGLGLTAVGDAVAAMNTVYGSTESINLIDDIYKHLALNSYRSSVQLAKERGAFPVYDYNLERNHPFINQIMDLDPQLKQDWQQYGRRNIANTTTAPAGSVSVLTQTTSGIEPAFLLSYKRRRKINPGDHDARVDFVDDMGDKWTEYTVYHHWFKKWMEITGKTNPEESPYHGATSNDINWVNKVKAQAAAQKWICHSISNTTNVPEDTTIDTIKDIYMAGWELGTKGVTVYRDKCRTGVLVTEENTRPTSKFQHNHAPKRPEKLPCDIYHMQVRSEKWNFFVGLYDDRPYEIFAGRSEHIHLPRSRKNGMIKKNGTYNLYTGEGDNELVIKDLASVFENTTESAFTRTVSLALRHGTPVQYIVEQIEKGADEDNEMFSLAKGLMRVLKHYIADGTKPSLKKCTNCGSKDLAYQEGCVTCQGCGHSKCG